MNPPSLHRRELSRQVLPWMIPGPCSSHFDGLNQFWSTVTTPIDNKDGSHCQLGRTSPGLGPELARLCRQRRRNSELLAPRSCEKSDGRSVSVEAFSPKDPIQQQDKHFWYTACIGSWRLSSSGAPAGPHLARRPRLTRIESTSLSVINITTLASDLDACTTVTPRLVLIRTLHTPANSFRQRQESHWTSSQP